MNAMTLFTDASHCPSSKFAGYGAWAKANGWTEGKFFGGKLSRCNSSTEAELAAIAEAMAYLRRNGRLFDVRTVMVQSDSVRALELMVKTFNATISNHVDGCALDYRQNIFPSPAERDYLEKIQTNRKDVALIVRHVRGHSRMGSRSRVNAICDLMARRHMREARGR